MKQSEILGLFTTPGDVRDYERAQLMKEAQMYTDPIAQQMYMATSDLAGAVGGAFGLSSGNVGEAQKIEEIRESVPFDVNNQSEYYTRLAQRLINEGLTKAGAQALELAKKAQLDEANIQSKLAKNAGLSVTAEKEINKANTAYSEAFGSASKAAEIAARFRSERGSMAAGFRAALGESWKDFVGDQDDVTLLRKDYAKLRATEGLQNLPPGAASDKDVEVALGPYPKETADPEYIASFLDGLAKANVLAAEFHKFRAQYLGANAGNAANLIPAWQEYYQTIDLDALFQQQGLRFVGGQVTTPAQAGQPSSGAGAVVNWSSME
jgi:hypothetical protein